MQIKLFFFPSQVGYLFWNMPKNPQCCIIWWVAATDWLVSKLTFSTFSTVKSSASGVATILPGVSISPLARSCQMIKEEQQFTIWQPSFNFPV